MDIDDILFDTAKELVIKVDKIVDDKLPNELVEIIKFHSKGAAGAGIASGWIPGAGGLALAGVTAGFVWSMYGRINKLLGIPFSENLVKSLASGVATNLASYVVASVVVSTCLSFIPGIGSLGATAIVGATSYALTLASGYVYMKVLIGLAKLEGLDNINEDILKREAEYVIQNSDIDQILKEAKKGYKA